MMLKKQVDAGKTERGISRPFMPASTSSVLGDGVFTALDHCVLFQYYSHSMFFPPPVSPTEKHRLRIKFLSAVLMRRFTGTDFKKNPKP